MRRRFVLTHETPERALGIVARRGVTLPVKADEARDVMIKLGVPESAIILPARIHDNTAQEAETLRELARQRGWHRIIVVDVALPSSSGGLCDTAGAEGNEASR